MYSDSLSYIFLGLVTGAVVVGAFLLILDILGAWYRCLENLHLQVQECLKSGEFRNMGETSETPVRGFREL